MYRPVGAGLPVQGTRELLQKFKIQKFLGKGSFGSVYRVQRISDGQIYACKETDVRTMPQGDREEAVNEIRLLASVQHPNVVGYHEAFVDGNKLCIVMEFAPLGDLSHVIKAAKDAKTRLPEDDIWKYFIQIARGLQGLHAMRILHRDIKPANIMVTDGNTVKIGDLGIARLMKNASMAKTQIGTPHYMPPEIWKNQPYTFTTDAWALGCVLYELAMLSVPFEARTMQELRTKVLKGTYPPISRQYSPELAQMVAKLMDMNPRTQAAAPLAGVHVKVPPLALPLAQPQAHVRRPEDLRSDAAAPLQWHARTPPAPLANANPAVPAAGRKPSEWGAQNAHTPPASVANGVLAPNARQAANAANGNAPLPSGRRPSDWGLNKAHASPAPSVISGVATPPILDRPARATPANPNDMTPGVGNPKSKAAAIQGLAAQQRARAVAAAQQRAAQYLERYARAGQRSAAADVADPVAARVANDNARERETAAAAAAAEQEGAEYLRQYERALQDQEARAYERPVLAGRQPGMLEYERGARLQPEAAQYERNMQRPDRLTDAELAELALLRRRAVERASAAEAAGMGRSALHEPQVYLDERLRKPAANAKPNKLRQQTSNAVYGACYAPKSLSQQQRAALLRHQQEVAQRERELQAMLPASQWHVQTVANNQRAAAQNAERMRSSHILPPFQEKNPGLLRSSYQAAYNRPAPHLRAAIHGGAAARDLIYGGGAASKPVANPNSAAYSPNINRVRLPPIAAREARQAPIGHLGLPSQDPACLGRRPWV
ncbi:hypothetical protein WJX72_006685 [[Myrmecia] bisecta]|uniref:non-specific serine/threonine protein kinase n=1 Tax=[Myrmecia] bisecta TaxID=41462 RepID=A0AAW1PNY2_9CHLO